MDHAAGRVGICIIGTAAAAAHVVAAAAAVIATAAAACRIGAAIVLKSSPCVAPLS